MRKNYLAGLGLALALAFAPAQAGIDLNEVGAFLVYPGVAAFETIDTETFLTITNTSTLAVIAHVSFIDGDSCYECDFDVPMSGLDTETLVLNRENGVTHIINLDTGASRSCAQSYGFVTVDIEDADHNVLTDNILLGEEVVVNYRFGWALSVPAVSIQAESGGLDREFSFDGKEYRKFPSVVGADFLAPDYGVGRLDADLVLFTLAFDRQFPPLTDCSVIGFDAFEEQFSNSFQFGCWTIAPLDRIDPEFAWPHLGVAFDGQEHGWLQLTCTVFGTGKNGVIDGGVHGAIVQTATPGTILRRESGGPALNGFAAWGRLLYQSGTVGDAMTLGLEDPARGGGF
jgi:hypothetical protein